jgi:hypothetical protein
VSSEVIAHRHISVRAGLQTRRLYKPPLAERNQKLHPVYAQPSWVGRARCGASRKAPAITDESDRPVCVHPPSPWPAVVIDESVTDAWRTAAVLMSCSVARRRCLRPTDGAPSSSNSVALLLISVTGQDLTRRRRRASGVPFVVVPGGSEPSGRSGQRVEDAARDEWSRFTHRRRHGGPALDRDIARVPQQYGLEPSSELPILWVVVRAIIWDASARHSGPDLLERDNMRLGITR